MKHLLSLLALTLSLTGIFVSLAREELRCRLGLGGQNCPTAPLSPQSRPSWPVILPSLLRPSPPTSSPATPEPLPLPSLTPDREASGEEPSPSPSPSPSPEPSVELTPTPETAIPIPVIPPSPIEPPAVTPLDPQP